MDKSNLQARLTEIEKSIEEKNRSIQQGMADLNVLIGCKSECLHWINQCDSKKVENFNVINKDPISLEDLKNILGADKVELA